MFRTSILTIAAAVLATAASQSQAQSYLGSIPTAGHGQNSGFNFGATVGPNGDLYVALCGAAAFVNPQFSNNNVVVRVNTTTNSVVATIPVGLFPEEIAFATPAGEPAVGIVTNSTDGTVTIFDVATDTPLTTLTIGGGFFASFPFGVETSADGARAYVGADSGTLYAIDTVGSSATAFQLLPAENITLTSGGAQKFHRFGNDLVCGTAAYLPAFAGSTAQFERVPLPGSSNVNTSLACYSSSSFTYPSIQDVAVDANGIAYGVGYDSDSRVYGYDVNTGRLVRSFPSGTTGKGLYGAALSPDGKVLVVCDIISNEVSFLDVARGMPIAVVDLVLLPFGGFQQPNDAAFSADGSTVYVTCQASEAILRFSAPPTPAPYVTTLNLTIEPTTPALNGAITLSTSGANPGDFVGILYDEADAAVDLGFGIFHLTPAAVLLASANGVDVVLNTTVPSDPVLFGKNFLCQAAAFDLSIGNFRLSDEVPVVLQ